VISTTARRKRKVVVPTPPTPAVLVVYVPSPEFAAAYVAPHNEVGPIISRWEGNRAVWLLATNSPTEFRRNHPRG
jgi:hypothetical protein